MMTDPRMLPYIHVPDGLDAHPDDADWPKLSWDLPRDAPSLLQVLVCNRAPDRCQRATIADARVALIEFAGTMAARAMPQETYDQLVALGIMSATTRAVLDANRARHGQGRDLNAETDR